MRKGAGKNYTNGLFPMASAFKCERVNFYSDVRRRRIILKVGILSKRHKNEKRHHHNGCGVESWGIHTHSRTTIGDENDESRHMYYILRSFATSGMSDVNVVSSKLNFRFSFLFFHILLHIHLSKCY